MRSVILSCMLFLCSVVHAEPELYSKIPGQIRVMVIDTGVSNHKDLKPFVQTDDSEDYVDRHGHGTHIAGIIMFGDLNENYEHTPSCDMVKIFSCKYVDKADSYNQKNFEGVELAAAIMTARCIDLAIENNIDIINYSSNGLYFSIDEYNAVKRARSAGIVIVTAVGNGAEKTNIGYSLDKSPTYPAGYIHETKIGKDVYPGLDNIIPVGNLDKYKHRNVSSNFGWDDTMKWEIGTMVYSTGLNDQYAYMSGTSQATATYTHNLIKKNCEALRPQKERICYRQLPQLILAH